MRERGVNVPLVADIHFNPAAAFAAIGNVEKIRINPGNFVDPGRVFKKIDYTDSEYQSELQRLRPSSENLSTDVPKLTQPFVWELTMAHFPTAL